MTDNKSAFAVNRYDENVRKVIPFYDEIYEQIFSVIQAHCSGKPLAVLDTGCGTGNLGAMALNRLNLSELVLCDPSEKMLADAREKLNDQPCKFRCVGSEKLDFENRFDVVTAIQSHHYFDRVTREVAVRNCFKALKAGGIFICFENTAPFTECGKELLLKRVEAFGLAAGRTPEEVKSHSARYNSEFFPITITEHLELFRRTGFAVAELFWHSYMQSGFYAVKKG
ncbi:MAG: methyltransferase domain-containing protein [Ruminococcus sp.]|nr:methyltransferase domain-containing protein [Ruminococcus sp.]